MILCTEHPISVTTVLTLYFVATASVEVKTGKRRIIEFLLSPVMKYGDESLRER